MNQNHISGLIAATFTPMDMNGNLNLDVIDTYAEHLIQKGLNGVFVCGTSGEGLLLTVEERMQVLESWMPFQNRLKIIAHVATTNYKDSRLLAAHAQELGVDAISCMGPCYLPPQRAEELVAYVSKIAEAVDETPFYYYHLPNVSGVHVKMNDFLKLATDSIPNLTGIKYTSFDLMDMQECILLEDGKFNILHGHDEILLSGLAVGARGGVGTSFNLVPEIYNGIIEAFFADDMDLARELQLRSIEFVKIMLKYENSVVSTKAMLNLAGLDLGPVRLPLRNLTAAEYNSLEEDLKVLGFYDEMVV